MPPRPARFLIRAENPARIWERRAPLSPAAVRAILDRVNGKGNKSRRLEVWIESCQRRCWRDSDYEKAGAYITPPSNTSLDFDVSLGIKEPSIPSLSSLLSTSKDRTHLFFSHTTKAQPSSRPLLSAFLNSDDTLIDYEHLTSGSDGPRLIYFSKHAGILGTLFSLHALSLSLLRNGLSTPLLHTPLPYTLQTMEDVKQSMQRVGGLITKEGLGKAKKGSPIVMTVTGSGNVTKGILETLSHLPTTEVIAKDLPALMEEKEPYMHTIYLVHATLDTYIHPRASLSSNANSNTKAHSSTTPLASPSSSDIPAQFNKQHYYANPHLYESQFFPLIAPYTSLLINGALWPSSLYPRLMSTNELHQSVRLARDLGRPPIVIGDISCDIEGSDFLCSRQLGGLEFVSKASTIDEPIWWIPIPEDPHSKSRSEMAISQTQVAVTSIDILPSTLPIPSSEYFSERLVEEGIIDGVLERYLPNADADAEVQDILDRATVVKNGRLVEKYKWLGDALRAPSSSDVGQGEAMKSLQVEQGQARRTSVAHVPSRKLKEYSGGGQRTMIIPPPPVSRTTGRSPAISLSPPSRRSYSTSPPSSPAYKNKKKVLLLGSGMVSLPFITRLLSEILFGIELVIGTANVSEAQSVLNSYETFKRAQGTEDGNSVAIKKIDVSLSSVDREDGALDGIIKEADIVVSLLPPPFHPSIARRCISHGTHLVTASYISPEMKELDSSAKRSSTILLNEIGLDPGLDHCSAIQLLRIINKERLLPRSFVSFCGGLPAPSSLFSTPTSTSGIIANPLNYKFSWSPLGVLRASLNGARYLLNEKDVDVPDGGLLDPSGKHVWADISSSIPGWKAGAGGEEIPLVGLPNRDSLVYKDVYGLGESMRSVLRGTLRYPGFTYTLHLFNTLGLLDSSRPLNNIGKTWDTLVGAALANRFVLKHSLDGESVRAFLRDWAVFVSRDGTDAYSVLEGLGLVPSSSSSSVASSREEIILPPSSGRTALDFLSAFLAQKFAYKEGEEDMVILTHEIIASPSHSSRLLRGGNMEERFTSTLIVTGTPSSGHSAMARTVGIPLAIATLDVLGSEQRLLDVTGGGGVCGGGVVWESVMNGIREGYGGGIGGFEFVEERVPARRETSMEGLLTTN